MIPGEILRPRDSVELRSGNTVLCGTFVAGDTLRRTFDIFDARGIPVRRDFYATEDPAVVYTVPPRSEVPTTDPQYACAPFKRLPRRHWTVIHA